MTTKRSTRPLERRVLLVTGSLTNSASLFRVSAPNPVISVIVPSFNKAEFLRETLDSVLSQDGIQLDLIVVDDASTDDSWEIVQAYGRRLRALRQPRNAGAPAARNAGARLARGDYLMFLDADDVLAPGTLEGLHEAITERTGVVAVCAWRQMRREGDRWIVVDSGKPGLTEWKDPVEAWLANWYYPPCAVMWPRDVFARSGGWDESLRAWQDTDIMIRVLLRGIQLALASTGEAYYRLHGRGSSLSSVSSAASAASRTRVLDKIVEQADRKGVLGRYRIAVGRSYYQLARGYAKPYPDLALECLRKADRHLGRTPLHGSGLHRLLWRAFGLERKERITTWLAKRGLVRREGSATVTGSTIS